MVCFLLWCVCYLKFELEIMKAGTPACRTRERKPDPVSGAGKEMKRGAPQRCAEARRAKRLPAEKNRWLSGQSDQSMNRPCCVSKNGANELGERDCAARNTIFRNNLSHVMRKSSTETRFFPFFSICFRFFYVFCSLFVFTVFEFYAFSHHLYH